MSATRWRTVPIRCVNIPVTRTFWFGITICLALEHIVRPILDRPAWVEVFEKSIIRRTYVTQEAKQILWGYILKGKIFMESEPPIF